MVPIARSTGRDLVSTKENLAPRFTAAVMTLPLPNAQSPRHGMFFAPAAFAVLLASPDHTGRAVTGTGSARAQPDPGQYRGGLAGGDRGGQWRQSLTRYLVVRDLRVPERSALFGAAVD